jgi:simple sugar transport system permease protein
LRSERWGALPALGLAVIAGLVTLAASLTLFGYNAASALSALWLGGFGTVEGLVSATLPRAVPLILIGLGQGLAFRGGALNIGAEGQFYSGAAMATWIGLSLGGWPRLIAVPLILLAGVGAGLMYGLVPVWLRLRFGVLEVISTLLLNFVAEGVVSYLVQGPLMEPRHIYPQSDLIPMVARLPLLPGTRLHLGMAVALTLAIGIWVFERRTRPGFMLHAAGLNPAAAWIMGRIDTRRVFALALLASAALAGLAGAAEISGSTYALFQNLSPGYGFTGIAVALLARLHPLGIVASGLLFAGLEAGAGAMQRDAGVPAVIVSVVEAAIILTVLLGDAAARRRLRAAEGM